MAKKIEPKKKAKPKPQAAPKGPRRNPNPPPAEHRWKPGQSGNVNGARAHDPEIKKLKNLTKAELVEVGNIIVKGNVEDLKQVSKSADATVLQTMLASVAARIISKGDMAALDVLLNRLVGKVKDEVKLGGEIKLPQVVITLPSNRKEAV